MGWAGCKERSRAALRHGTLALLLCAAGLYLAVLLLTQAVRVAEG